MAFFNMVLSAVSESQFGKFDDIKLKFRNEINQNRNDIVQKSGSKEIEIRY